MTVVGPPQTLTSADLLRQKISGDGQPSQSSGTAWAAITAPGVGSIWDKTAIEARVDPAQEQSKLGTSLSKSLPLGEQYSLTLQNGYNVIQQGIVPVPGIAAHPSAQLPDRAIGEAEHCRYRHQFRRRPVAVLHRGQMAAQDRRRAEIVRRRHRQRLDRRNRARHLQQESERRLQAQLVSAAARSRASLQIPRKIEHCRILAAMRSKSAALMALLNFVVRGTTALATHAGEKPMNATIRSDKVESTEADPNLAAVSEVEAGIRDFVRNDVAYLRRPPTLTPDAPRSSPAPRPPSTTSTR